MISIAIQIKMALKLQTFPNCKVYFNSSFFKDKNRSRKQIFVVNFVLVMDCGCGETTKAGWPVRVFEYLSFIPAKALIFSSTG